MELFTPVVRDHVRRESQSNPPANKKERGKDRSAESNACANDKDRSAESNAFANNMECGNQSSYDRACAFGKESEHHKEERKSEREKLKESSRIFFAVT